MENGTRFDADMLIFELGDFSHIRTPAKCAARIGQTFTDTSNSIAINPAIVDEMEDVEINGYVFSDGVGTCSLEVLRVLQATQKPSSIPATVFQIRYAGAKAFLEKHHIGKSTQTPWLLRKMQHLGLELSDDAFFRNLLDAAVLVELQDLKYKTRLPVEEGATLYGIMDETGILEEGEVYCCWIDRNGQKKHADGTVAVSRSPAHHPGDVQLARAVNIPDDSPLNALHNCLVFSAKGQRDLPSKLSGGDLDGDLFQIIWDRTLIPAACEKPSGYSKRLPEELDRQVTRKDMSDHFIDFMKNDLLGRVANLHMILADQYEQGSLHNDCKLLANLHSTAVDFSKTGISISYKQLPNSFSSRYRPDFMAPGRSVKTEKHGWTIEDELIDLFDKNDLRRAGERDRKRYYESKKILGILYRSIDEGAFVTDLRKRSPILKDDGRTSRGVLAQLCEYVLSEADGLLWDHYKDYAVAMRDSYEAAVCDIILQYSTNPLEYLEEIEIFMRNIICRNGYRSQRQREFMMSMKEKYNREARAYMAAMHDPNSGFDYNGEHTGDENHWHGLRRSMACLYIGIQQPSNGKGRVDLGTDTFGWVAAATVMRELEVYQEDRDVGPLRKALRWMKRLGK
ncbi:MAG: hypothetical protein Q9221_002155 [Calogaya cf. arnoldii]